MVCADLLEPDWAGRGSCPGIKGQRLHVCLSLACMRVSQCSNQCRNCKTQLERGQPLRLAHGLRHYHASMVAWHIYIYQSVYKLMSCRRASSAAPNILRRIILQQVYDAGPCQIQMKVGLRRLRNALRQGRKEGNSTHARNHQG